VIKKMAKQVGEKFITGTYGDVCFYYMQGQYYARMKSSLNSKRVKRDKRFERTMQLAHLFGVASKIVSLLYRKLPKTEQGKDVRYMLLRKARLALAAGKSKDAVIALLKKEINVARGETMIRKVFKKKSPAKKQKMDYTPSLYILLHFRGIYAQMNCWNYIRFVNSI